MTTETLTVRMSRSDPSIIWGFRLQGGRDISTPLTISKVVEGSLAERAGLVNGDHVVQICGKDADQMYHRDAQDAVIASGNDLELIIERTGSKIWKPTVSATGDYLSPVKYSLAHHDDMFQEDSYRNSGSRVVNSSSSFTRHNVAPQPVQQRTTTKSTDSYLRETGGLFGTDSNVQKYQQQQPTYLQSQTLRLIRESEATGRPGGSGHSVEPPSDVAKGGAFFEPPRMHGTSGAPVCDTCGRPIHGVFCKADDKCFHGDCFKCSTCGTSLKNVGHYMVHNKLYCDIHARQQQQDHFRATAPQDPSIFSFRGAPPQPSPKHSEPPRAFYQPDVLKPSVSPIPHVHSAPLSPQSRGIPTHLVSKMPGSALRQAHEELGLNQPPPPPPPPMGGLSRGAHQDWSTQQHLQSAGCQEVTEQINHAAYTEKMAEEPRPRQRLSLKQQEVIGDEVPGVEEDGGGPRKGSNVIMTAGDIICAHLASVHEGSKPEATSRTVGSYMPRRGRGILKQLHDVPRVPVCEACQREIRGPFVLALSKTWCPDHFTCAHPDCRRKLLDVGFVEEAGFVYCEFCFEKYLAPSCNKCHRPIVGDTLTAMEKKWHPECFCCAHCHQPFGNSCFFLEDGKPFCEKDWNGLFTTKCSACQFPIEAGDRWVEALGNAYHSNCFNCTVCQRSLEGQNFYVKGGHPYCKAHV